MTVSTSSPKALFERFTEHPSPRAKTEIHLAVRAEREKAANLRLTNSTCAVLELLKVRDTTARGDQSAKTPRELKAALRHLFCTLAQLHDSIDPDGAIFTALRRAVSEVGRTIRYGNPERKLALIPLAATLRVIHMHLSVKPSINLQTDIEQHIVAWVSTVDSQTWHGRPNFKSSVLNSIYAAASLRAALCRGRAFTLESCIHLMDGATESFSTQMWAVHAIKQLPEEPALAEAIFMHFHDLAVAASKTDDVERDTRLTETLRQLSTTLRAIDSQLSPGKDVAAKWKISSPFKRH